MLDQIKQLQRKIDTLQSELEHVKRQFQKLGVAASIPFNVENAFKSRLLTDLVKDLPVISGSAQSPQTTNIDEAGEDAHTVASPMDGFITITSPEGEYYIPYYEL